MSKIKDIQKQYRKEMQRIVIGSGLVSALTLAAIFSLTAALFA